MSSQPDLSTVPSDLFADEHRESMAALLVDPTPSRRPLRPSIAGRLLRGFALSERPAQPWLVDQWLPAGSLTFLYGPPKSGKSFVALDLAASVATGRLWAEHSTRQAPVLYVIGEGQGGMPARQSAWAEHNGASTNDLDNLLWCPRPVDLNERASVEDLAQVAAREGVGMIVLDTFARCTAGADENSTKDMGTVVHHLSVLQELTRACVLVVHHAGKDQSRGMRGSSVLLGAADVVLQASASKGQTTVRCTDAKDFASGVTTHLRHEQVLDSLVLVRTHDLPNAAAAPDSALLALEALETETSPEGMRWVEWFKASGQPKATFNRCLKTLVADGSVVQSAGRYLPA